MSCDFCFIFIFLWGRTCWGRGRSPEFLSKIKLMNGIPLIHRVVLGTFIVTNDKDDD